MEGYDKLRERAAAEVGKEECTDAEEEVLASLIYAEFVNKKISKPIAAQYLAERLQARELTSEQLRNRLPTYLLNAIEYVTGGSSIAEPRPEHEDGTDE